MDEVHHDDDADLKSSQEDGQPQVSVGRPTLQKVWALRRGDRDSGRDGDRHAPEVSTKSASSEFGYTRGEMWHGSTQPAKTPLEAVCLASDCMPRLSIEMTVDLFFK